MKPISKKTKQTIWRVLLVLGLLCELVLITLAIKSMVQEHETIPHWQAITFVAIAVWIYIAYLKQHSLDISKFVVDEKIKTHSLAQHLSEGVLLLDDGGRVLFLNARAATLVGADELAALGQPYTRLIDVADADWLAPGRAGEVPGTARAGGARLCLRVIHLDAEGGVAGHKLVYVSPAAQEQPPSESAPILSNDRIIQAAGTVEKLSASAEDALLGVEGRRLALELRSMAHDGWLASLPADQVLHRRAKFDAVKWLDETIESLRPAAAVLGVTVNAVHSVPTLPASGDCEWIKSALIQVLLNALLGAGQGGNVIVKSAAMGAHAGIAVDDSGASVTTDGAAALFARSYVGVPGSNGETVRQDGVGLFLARRVLEKHGGMLSVDPLPAGGLRVTIMLPVD